MIIVLSSTDAPRLTDLDRLDRLHADIDGDLDDALFDELCQPGAEGHVWLVIEAARRLGADATADPTFGERFDAMIEFAGAHGWLDDDATHVRAHVQQAD